MSLIDRTRLTQYLKDMSVVEGLIGAFYSWHLDTKLGHGKTTYHTRGVRQGCTAAPVFAPLMAGVPVLFSYAFLNLPQLSGVRLSQPASTIRSCAYKLIGLVDDVSVLAWRRAIWLQKGAEHEPSLKRLQRVSQEFPLFSI